MTNSDSRQGRHKEAIRFNINEFVRVRLTPHGHKIHRARFRELNAQLPLGADLQYTPPKEDKDGWSRWQLWSLMRCFGEHIGMGAESPFEMTIEFIADSSVE